MIYENIRRSIVSRWIRVEKLYFGYAEFHQVPINSEILDIVWNWIFDEDDAFYILVANNKEKRLLGSHALSRNGLTFKRQKGRFFRRLFCSP